MLFSSVLGESWLKAKTTATMFYPRIGIFKNTTTISMKSPVLAIIALITIGGSMCFVAGGLFLFSAISLHQSEKYCSGFLIIFVGIVLMATCYLAWVLTSHRFNNWISESTVGMSSETTENDEAIETPPSYDEAVKDM